MHSNQHLLFSSWLEEKTAVYKQNAISLRNDQREDEAIFAEIEANVCDAFRTVHATALRVSKTDTEAADFFWKRLKSIPQNWKNALERAHQHDNQREILIETRKLQVAEAIKNQFCQIWELDI